jgi:hypothetical protein
MTCTENKHFSRFELINIPVSVHSPFSSEREQAIYPEANFCSLHTRAPLHLNINPLKNKLPMEQNRKKE